MEPEFTVAEMVLVGNQADVGMMANTAASRSVFADYMSRRAESTLKRQKAGLDLFASYLQEVGVTASGQEFQTDPGTWQNVTWGLVQGFVNWLLLQGYAVSTVNLRLSTIKVYAKLARQAGTLSDTEYGLIKLISGYSHKEAVRLDTKRNAQGIPTRYPDGSGKKAMPVRLTPELAQQLKMQDTSTGTGRRDVVMMALLLDHGLRAGELAGLTVENIDFNTTEMVFYRPKVDKTQVHRLSPDAMRTLLLYRDSGDMPTSGLLLRNSRKGGILTTQGMTERKISKRVRFLGSKLGIDGLSAHDCRHYWATAAARRGVDAFRLQEAGGWSSLVMPRRYVEDARIANDGWMWGG